MNGSFEVSEGTLTSTAGYQLPKKLLTTNLCLSLQPTGTTTCMYSGYPHQFVTCKCRGALTP